MDYLTAALVAGILVLAWNLYRAHVTIANLALEASVYKAGYQALLNYIEVAANHIKEGPDEEDR